MEHDIFSLSDRLCKEFGGKKLIFFESFDIKNQYPMTTLFNMEGMLRIKDDIEQYIQIGNLDTNTVGAYRMRENYGYEFSLNGQRGLFKIIYDSRNNTFSLTQIETLAEGRNTTNPIINETLKKCMEFIYTFKNNC